MLRISDFECSAFDGASIYDTHTQGSKNISEDRAERILEPEDGEEGCDMLPAEHNMALACMDS